VQDETLPQPERDKILAMADTLELNEYECDRYWRLAKSQGDREKLSSIVGKIFMTRDIESAAKEFYIMECESLLDSILYLFRARKSQNLNELGRRSIRSITDGLMGRVRGDIWDGIGVALMKVLVRFIETMCDANKSVEKRHLTEKLILRVTESLFYIFYGADQFRVNLTEAKQMISCIHELSERCNKPISDITHWHYPMFSSLVVMQLTLARALRPHTMEDPVAPIRLEDLRAEMIWNCTMAHGFCSLVFSVFYDSTKVEDLDLKRLLDGASRMRAFCYTRRCILPLLQCVSSFRAELQLDLVHTLSEFLQNILVMLNTRFGMSPDHAECLHHRSAYRELEVYKRNQGMPGDAMPFQMVDVLDDVLDLVYAVGRAYPSFADKFWNALNETDPPRPSKILFNTTRHNIADDSMRPALTRFFIGFSGGGRNIMATKGIFNYNCTRTGEYNWHSMFGFIEYACNDMAAIEKDETLHMSEKLDLFLAYEEKLLPFMEFICTATQAQGAADMFVEIYRPIESLFRLVLLGISFRGIFYTVIPFNAALISCYQFRYSFPCDRSAC